MIFAMARGAFWARLTPTTSCPDPHQQLMVDNVHDNIHDSEDMTSPQIVQTDTITVAVALLLSLFLNYPFFFTRSSLSVASS